jgi:hypothetical protein
VKKISERGTWALRIAFPQGASLRYAAAESTCAV